MKHLFKKTLSALLSLLLVLSTFSFAFSVSGYAAEGEGEQDMRYPYYIKLVINVTNTCQGWTSSSLFMSYAMENGTGATNSTELFESTSDDIWNKKGEHVIYEGTYGGFPKSYTHNYSFGGGFTWRKLSYTLTIYAGKDAATAKEVLSKSFTAESSAFSAAAGAFTAEVTSNLPKVSSCRFISGATSATVPRDDEVALSLPYVAKAYDQYGVEWHGSPTISLAEAQNGVSVIGDNLVISRDANSYDGSDQTVNLNAIIRTSTDSKTITISNAKYTYKFVDANDATISSGTLKYGQNIPYPSVNPVKEYTNTMHYNFTGWSSNDVRIKTDTTFTPQYTAERHSYKNYIPDGNATCTSPGTKTATCSCGHKNTVEDTGSQLGHSYKSSITTPATCTEAGVLTYKCIRCDDSYTEQIAPTGHSLGDWAVTTPATCHDAGVETRRCANCDYYETRDIPKLEHDMGEWETAVEPTCTVNGVLMRKCSHCGYAETQNIDALGHNVPDSSWKLVTSPTCQTVGTRQGSCTRCGEVYTEIIPMTGHNFSEWNMVTEPTCEGDGMLVRTCSVCGNFEIDILEALGHNYEMHSTAPSDGKQGAYYYSCDKCGKYFSCKLDGEGEKTVDSSFNTYDEALAATLKIPAVSFNTYNRKESNYNYVNRCAALKLGGATDDYTQGLRFASSMQLPEGAELIDFGYVYTQEGLLLDVNEFVIGGNNVADVSLKNGHFSTFKTDKGTVYTFNLVINVNRPNWNIDYLAKPYITYKYLGQVYTIYDIAYSQRSVVDIARLVVANDRELQSTRDFFNEKVLNSLGGE